MKNNLFHFLNQLTVQFLILFNFDFMSLLIRLF
jgi:hypothetical protein